jgi:hypothetical protein
MRARARLESMNIASLRELRNARPFVPFRIFRNNGNPIDVTNPDCIGISPKGSWVLLSSPGDGPTRIAANDISRTEVIGFPAPEDMEFL